MNTRQVRFNKISSADFRGFNRSRGQRQFDNMQRNDRFKNNDSNGNQSGNNTREMGIVLLEIEGKAEEILEVLCMVRVEEEVDLTKVQMSDIQE